MATITVSNIYDLSSFIKDSLVGIDGYEGPSRPELSSFFTYLPLESFYGFAALQGAVGNDEFVLGGNTSNSITGSSSYSNSEYEDGSVYSYKTTLTYTGSGLLLDSINENSTVTGLNYSVDVSLKQGSTIIESYKGSLAAKVFFDAYVSESIEDLPFMYMNGSQFIYQGSESGFDEESGNKYNSSYRYQIDGDLTFSSNAEDFNPFLSNIEGILTNVSISQSDVGKSGSTTIFEDNFSLSFSNPDGITYLNYYIEDTRYSWYEGSFNNLSFSSRYTAVSGEDDELSTQTFSYQSKDENPYLADALNNYEGEDYVILEALLFGNDNITGTSSYDYLLGMDGNDLISGLGESDLISGGNGKDTLRGGDGNDLIAGGNDRDSLDGGNQNDYLYGEDGNDIIIGGGGNDLLTGGLGADSLTGGTGSDGFIFNSKILYNSVSPFSTEAGNSDSGVTRLGADLVRDFVTGQDQIYININDYPIEAPPRELGSTSIQKLGTAVGNYNQALSRANKFFTNDLASTDKLYFAFDRSNGYLFVDSDNNGKADMSIVLVGINAVNKINSDDIIVTIGGGID